MQDALSCERLSGCVVGLGGFYILSPKGRCVAYPVHGFPRQAGHFFSGMSNRVEHQKLNQVAAELAAG